MENNFACIHVQGAPVPIEIDLKIAGGRQVMEKLSPGHGCPKFQTLHLDLLLVQLLVPNLRGLPVLDVSTPSEQHSELAYYTYVYGGSRWLYVLVGGKGCCVLQLLGLTQFVIIPRHPQSKGKKFVNWGYGSHGICKTYIYHGAATVRGRRATERIVL